MLRFYFTLVRDIPRVLRGTHEAWAYWLLSVGVPVVLAFKPKWRPITESGWLIAVPVAVSTAYGMLRVNYQRYRELEIRAGVRATRAQRIDALRGLGTVHSTWSGHPVRPLSGSYTLEQLRRDMSTFDFAVDALFTQPGMDSVWRADYLRPIDVRNFLSVRAVTNEEAETRYVFVQELRRVKRIMAKLHKRLEAMPD